MTSLAAYATFAIWQATLAPHAAGRELALLIALVLLKIFLVAIAALFWHAPACEILVRWSGYLLIGPYLLVNFEFVVTVATIKDLLENPEQYQYKGAQAAAQIVMGLLIPVLLFVMAFLVLSQKHCAVV